MIELERYEFGVMSTKFSLEAEDDITAKISMSIFFGKNIPIVVYSPQECAFMPEKILEENKDSFDADKVKKCLKTIKKIR